MSEILKKFEVCFKKMKVLRMSFYINEGYTTEGYIFALIITMTIIKPG